MSMFNDIVWDAKGNEELCEKIIQKELKHTLEDFLLVQKRSGTPHADN